MAFPNNHLLTKQVRVLGGEHFDVTVAHKKDCAKAGALLSDENRRRLMNSSGVCMWICVDSEYIVFAYKKMSFTIWIAKDE